jgi:hypothetical protein
MKARSEFILTSEADQTSNRERRRLVKLVTLLERA